MEETIKKTYKLSQSARKIMIYINEITGLDSFILYGGTPIDLIINNKRNINDYDIAISSKNPEKIKEVKKFLIKNGFEIIESSRKYYIYNNIEVVLIYARKGRILLDICFMEDVSLVGQFNIESLYWRYPEMECVDKYNAVESIKNKKLIPIRGIEKENKFLLISRFIYLCSKYNISLFNDGGKYVNLINKKLQNKNDNTSEQFVSCLSSILKSILRAKHRKVFIKELIDSGIIKKIFPLLELSLINFMKNKQNSELIMRIKDKKSLLLCLGNNLDKRDGNAFMEVMKILSKRTWDKQDVNII